MPPLCLCSDIRANSTNGHAGYAKLCNYIDVATLCKTECPHTWPIVHNQNDLCFLGCIKEQWMIMMYRHILVLRSTNISCLAFPLLHTLMQLEASEREVIERRCDHFMRNPEVADYCSSLKLMPFESATFNPIAKIRSKNQGSKTEGGGCGCFLAPRGQRVTRSCSAISVGRRPKSTKSAALQRWNGVVWCYGGSSVGGLMETSTCFLKAVGWESFVATFLLVWPKPTVDPCKRVNECYQSADDQELITRSVMLGKLRFATTKWKCSGHKLKLPWEDIGNAALLFTMEESIDNTSQLLKDPSMATWHHQHEELEGLSGKFCGSPNFGYGTSLEQRLKAIINKNEEPT